MIRMTLIMITTLVVFNSLAPGKFEWNFRYVIFKWILVIDGWGISYEIAPIWMSLDFTGDQSTLVQVMAWCHQATSHYLSQCSPRFCCHMVSLGQNELIDWSPTTVKLKWSWTIWTMSTDISSTFIGNKLVDHSDVVGASPGSTAPIASSFST